MMGATGESNRLSVARVVISICPSESSIAFHNE